MSTRMIGALIMTHSDDDGLVLPPRIATKHIVIQPIYRNEEERGPVLEYCQSLRKELAAVQYDGRGLEGLHRRSRDARRREKKWYHVKRGVPIRLEVGPRDVAAEKSSPPAGIKARLKGSTATSSSRGLSRSSTKCRPTSSSGQSNSAKRTRHVH